MCAIGFGSFGSLVPLMFHLLDREELRQFLDEKAAEYENPRFIENDPVQFIHLFNEKLQDVEIAGLFAATWAWGQRKSIRASLHRLNESWDGAPYDFIQHASEHELKKWTPSHRTFMPEDGRAFVRGLRNLYSHAPSLAEYFRLHPGENDYFNAIDRFRTAFLNAAEAPTRTHKHIASPESGSAAKRLHLYLRWMVRPSLGGVDIGVWNQLPKSALSCPLDVHSGRVARTLGLLHRTANDARAVRELDAQLRILDPQDPVKYDYALFGLGVEGRL